MTLAAITVTAEPGRTMGTLTAGTRTYPCTLGRSGIVSDAEKKEGDGATPAGHWPLRRLLVRTDRVAIPPGGLPGTPIGKNDGWCDAPDDPAYNQPVALPYAASAENLWREDGLYDLIAVLGHNDDPPVPGKGSAIFFHVAKTEGDRLQPTEGCVALPLASLVEVLSLCGPETVMEIRLGTDG